MMIYKRLMKVIAALAAVFLSGILGYSIIMGVVENIMQLKARAEAS
jgi:hypothetical protein